MEEKYEAWKKITAYSTFLIFIFVLDIWFSQTYDWSVIGELADSLN